jgi:hypothetical protein
MMLTIDSSTCYSLLLFALVITTSTSQYTNTGTIGTTNDTILAAKEYYVVTKSNGVAQFQCVTSGSRCVFQRNDFTSTKAIGSDSQISETIQAPTWAAINVSSDRLQLNTCIGGSTSTATATAADTVSTATTRSTAADPKGCLVVCTAQCTCQYTDNSTGTDTTKDCLALPEAPSNNEIIQEAVTQAPKQPNTKDVQCPQSLNTNLCTQMMALPPPAFEKGLQFDCYNFCGGIFISSCDLQTGKCGAITCNNATADGTNTGRVFGCKDSHRPNTINSNTKTQASSAFTINTNTYGSTLVSTNNKLLGFGSILFLIEVAATMIL